MSDAIDFTLSNLPTTTTVLATMFIRLSTESSAASTTAEGIPKLQPGDLVLLRKDNVTPLHWPTDVNTDIHPGKDGIVRVVSLRVLREHSNVPPQKLSP
jgi:hypothetical protein